MNILRYKSNFMPTIMLAADLDSSNKGGGDDDQFGYNPVIGGDDTSDDKVDPDAPTYSGFGEDEENANTLDDDSGSNNDDADDPKSGNDEGDGDKDEANDENSDEDETPRPPDTETVLRAGKLGIPVETIEYYHGLGDGVLERYVSDFVPPVQDSDQNSDDQGEGTYKAPEAYKHELGDEYEEGATKAFDGLSEHVNGQFVETHKHIEDLFGTVLGIEAEQIAAQVNEYYDELADSKVADFKEIVGAGTDGVVPANSVASRNREAITKEMNSIQAQRRGRKIPVLTTKRCFTQALEKVTGQNIETSNKKTVDKLNQRSNGNSLRGGRKGKDAQKPKKQLSNADIAKLQEKKYANG